jgi:hypothetical protein
VNLRLGDAGSPTFAGRSTCHGHDVEMAALQVTIAVRGRLGNRLATAFDGMTPMEREGRTELVGEVVDQAHLHGLLSRIRDLGLELLEVSLDPDRANPKEA